MIAPYVALDVPSEVEAFGDSGGGEDGRELGWSRLRLLNSVVCVVRDCVDTILSHAAEHADASRRGLTAMTWHGALEKEERLLRVECVASRTRSAVSG